MSDDAEPLTRPSPAPAELLEVAIAAARAGGAVLVEGLGRPKQVELKTERASIVTWADVTAQRDIIELIQSHYPDHAILAEETVPEELRQAGPPGRRASLEASGAPTWLIDPLDGTSNYAHGIPFACTSVAVRDAAGLAAGAIFEPFRGELFTASRGGGAWLGDERLAVTTTEQLDRALVCTGVQSDEPEALAAFGRRMVALMTQCRGARCLGSPALCLAYIAAGRIDGFLERDATYAWDVGAGGLMIAEAGGRIEDLDGGPLNLGPGLANVLATNGRIHDELALLAREAN
jgi:myo-inositol-1(or 4)-monophosphatase